MSLASSFKRFFPLYLVIFFGYFGYALALTIFTPMFMKGSGGLISASASHATRVLLLGFVLTLYPLGQFLGSPIMGALSDRLGRRPVLVVTLIITTICYALIAISIDVSHLPLLCIVLFCGGFSESNVVTAQSAVADVIKPEERAVQFGYIYGAVSLSFAIAPLMGGKLATINYSLPFWITCGLLGAGTILVITLFKETLPHERRTRGRYFEAFFNLKGVFTHKYLRFYYLLNFLFYLSIYGYFRALPIYSVGRFAFDTTRLGYLIAWEALPIVISNFWLLKIVAKRVSPVHLTIISALFMGLLLIVMVIPPQAYWLWVTVFLAGIGLSFCLPTCTALLSLRAAEDEQGMALGNNQSIQVAAEALSSFLSGALATNFVDLPLIVWGAIAIAGALILTLHDRRQMRRSI